MGLSPECQNSELRAAMSLSRLWQRQGKQDEAHALLAVSTTGAPRGLTPWTCARHGCCWGRLKSVHAVWMQMVYNALLDEGLTQIRHRNTSSHARRQAWSVPSSNRRHASDATRYASPGSGRGHLSVISTPCTASEHDAKIRPYVESHRCPAIAHKQLAAGGTIDGICVGTVGRPRCSSNMGSLTSWLLAR
jgi:hypothetical protein